MSCRHPPTHQYFVEISPNFDDIFFLGSDTKWIYVGKSSEVEVKGIRMCKLELRRERTPLPHDVLYAPNIRRNLVFVLVLLGLGFNLNFHDSVMELYLGTTTMVLDLF